MKINDKISALSALLILITFNVSAQLITPSKIGNRIKQRIEERAADNVYRRVDNGVDKAVDGVFETADKGAKDVVNGNDKTETDGQEAATRAMSGLLGGLGKSVPPESSYEFDNSYTMKVTTSGGKENGVMMITYYFKNEAPYMGAKFKMTGTEGEQMAGQMDAMIFDFEKESVYNFMNTNGQKVVMGMSYANAKNMEDYANDKMAESVYTKTGQTKSILGYKCDGYLMTQGKDETLLWISQGRVPVISEQYKSFMKANTGQAKGMPKFNYQANEQIMKMVSNGQAILGTESKDGKETTSMEIAEIKANDSFKFSTEGYSDMFDFSKRTQGADN